MLKNKKKNVVRFLSLVMMSVFLTSMVLPVFPSAMAESEHFYLSMDQCFHNTNYDDEHHPTKKIATVNIFPRQEMNISHFEGKFGLTDITSGGIFQLDDIYITSPFSQIGNFTYSVDTGDYSWDGNGESVSVTEYSGSIVSAVYLISDGLVAGNYSFSTSFTAISDTGETIVQNENIEGSVEAGSYMHPIAGDFIISYAVVADKVYDGTTVATVTSSAPSDPDFEEGVDYTVVGTFMSANVGEHYVYVDVENPSEALREKYGGCIKTNARLATINPKEITISDVTLDPESFVYSGEDNNPDLTVTTSLDGGATTVNLREGTDFTLVRPSETALAGTKTIAFTAEGNYTGSFDINYDVEKAVSPNPPEMTDGYIVKTGKTLANIPGDRTLGFAWDDPDTIVLDGENTYPATYTYNNDSDNYTTISLNVPVYGDVTGVEYDVIDGDGGDYLVGSGIPMRFGIGVPRGLFDRGVDVYVDGELIEPDDYILEPDDTAVVLPETFLGGLSVGGHLFRAVFDDGGVATATFTVTEPSDDDSGYVPVPDTGMYTSNNSGVRALGATLIGVVVSVLVGMLFFVKFAKKQYRLSKISFNKK